MPLLRFSIFIFLCLINLGIMAFSDTECLQATFETEVSHKGRPFGLVKNTLKVGKRGCEVEVFHHKLKFIKNNWIIDVCREPIHIKKAKGAIEVIKKTTSCEAKESPFCSQYDELKTVIQDDGLIFAKGEKENLQSDHGRIYCAYLLLKAYMGRGIVFSRLKKYENVLKDAFLAPTRKKTDSSKGLNPPRPIVEGAQENSSEGVVPSSSGQGTGSF